MRAETARTIELLKSGMSEDAVVEQLIVDGYFGDVGGIRGYLKPVVREIANTYKQDGESQ